MADRIAQAARRSLPFVTSGEPSARWTSVDGDVQVCAWTNEPEDQHRPLLVADAPAQAALGLTGYALPALPPPAAVAAVTASEAAGRLSDLGGVWGVVGATPGRLTAATSATGAEQLFVAETTDAVVVGNRALAVHLVADPGGPRYDLVGLTGVVSAGYCLTERTSYAGVTAVPVQTVLRADRDGVHLVPIPAADPGAVGAATLAAALRESVSPLRGLTTPVRLGLTGGRDSRILVALLRAADVPVSTWTSGHPDDPDVVVARQIAERLRVRHTVQPPMGATTDQDATVIDVVSRVRDAVVLADGMLSAYDRVGRVNGTYDAHLVPLTGAGGGILRAYDAYQLAVLGSRADARRVMRTRLFGRVKLMTPAAREAHEREVAAWLDRVEADGAAALEEFFIRQRVARWTGAARGSASIGSLAWRPYLDHRVVRTTRAVPLERRVDERLMADILDLLAPELADVPFAGRRWRFEQEALPGASDRQARAAKKPVVGRLGDDATSVNWRTDYPEVISELRSIVLDGPSSLWEILDRGAVETYLDPSARRSRADAMGAWHLATVSAALSGRFDSGPERFGDLGTSVRVGGALAGTPRLAAARTRARRALLVGARRLARAARWK